LSIFEIATLREMAAVLDNVGKSNVSKKTEEVFDDDELEEDVEDGPTITKKKRKRRKKKTQTTGKCIKNIFNCLVLPCAYLDDGTDTKEKDEVEKEVTSGVTNINMDDEGEKKKSRRRNKKKETKVNEPESKEKNQTNPPSVPIHELFPTSN